MCDKKCCLKTSIALGIISALILIGALVGTSIKKLEAYEVGLAYNPVAVTIDETKLYTEGTHALGPGHYFITFNRQPRTIQLGSTK